MDRWATKDHYEREEEETERLVRPSPKSKPPRHDRRRERINTDPPEPSDKESSSVAVSVVARYLCAKDKEKVKVVRKDTGETTYIKPKTLKERPNEYSLAEEDSEDSAPWEPEDHEFHEKGKTLWNAAKNDPELKSVLDNIILPNSESGGLAIRTPTFPALPFMRGRPLPPGIENLGQLLKALEKGQKTPPKPKEEPKPEQAPTEEKTAPSAPGDGAPVADAKEPGDAAKEEGQAPESEAGGEDSQGADEEAPKPKKGKIPEPKRRKPEEWELAASRAAILETLPRGEMRDRLLDARMHPDDIGEVLAAYNTAKSRDLGPSGAGKLIDEARAWFQTDPTKVGPPKFGKDQAGVEKPFEELSPDDQAEAAAQHRNRTIALSLAAHDQVTRSLSKNLGAPPALADFLSAFLLGQKPPKEGEQPDPAQEAEKAKALAAKVFEKVVSDGQTEKISPSTVKNVLSFTQSNPTAERVAVSYFQSRDYQAARETYLSPESPLHISEHQGPTDIARGIVEGSRFLVDRSRLYPPAAITQDPAGAFRNRIMQHIRTLAPDKYPFVRKHVDMYEHQLYDAESARHKKVVEKVMGRYQKDVQKVLDKHDSVVEKLRSRHEKSIDTFREETKAFDKAYRKYIKEKIQHQKLVQKALQEAQDDNPPKELPEAPKPPMMPKPPPDLDLPDLPELPPEPILPEPPAKPVRYGLAEDDLEEERERLWAEQKRQASFYPARLSMDRQSVYWGVAPYPKGHEGFAPYPEWTQAHARDLGEKDYSSILKAAREWLHAPVLSNAIEGIEKDTQFRAALDLAIRSHEGGRYSVGLHPQIYNQLLARLAGKPENETLMTIRAHDSVYRSRGEKPMKASIEVRKFASTIADANPDVAYELVGLADRLAEDEQQAQQSQQAQEQKQAGEMPPALKEHMEKKKEEGGQDQGQEQQKQAYRLLKAAVLRVAQDNPMIRNPLMPVLQTIKQLG